MTGGLRGSCTGPPSVEDLRSAAELGVPIGAAASGGGVDLVVEVGQIGLDASVGGRADAAAAVPDRLVDSVAVVGPPGRIRDRIEVWTAAARGGSVGTMLLMKADAAALWVGAQCGRG